MEIYKLPYTDTHVFSKRDIAYIEEAPALRPFYKYPVQLEAFADVIADKKKDATDRQLLYEVLKSQYETLSPAPAVEANIASLRHEKTFTLVTAHQPSLFTGPLYYIYKIVSVLQLTERLKQTYPDYHFVPVFITSGEDHDFEEVNHLQLFNKKITWESNEKGSVGKMKTATLVPVLAELQQMLGESDRAKEIFSLFEKIHTGQAIYGKAAFELVHELFKADGLVALDTSDPRLKRSFAPIIRQEIFEQLSYKLVNKTISQLEAASYPAQATPREINFFYVAEGLRERIVQDDDQYTVLNTPLVFNKAQLVAEIEAHPERFSPNVVMRPLYQEYILPNLAYIGGGGELAYWLERKTQFEYFNLNFPMLVRRNSALLVDAGSMKKMEKMGLSFNDLWLEPEALTRQFLRKNAGADFQLNGERERLQAVFGAIAEKTETVDKTLVKSVWAEHARTLKSLEQLETRLVRAGKQKHETALQQLKSVKEKLFPGGDLQERTENFLPFYLKMGGDFFTLLKENFDPLEKRMVIISGV